MVDENLKSVSTKCMGLIRAENLKIVKKNRGQFGAVRDAQMNESNIEPGLEVECPGTKSTRRLKKHPI